MNSIFSWQPGFMIAGRILMVGLVLLLLVQTLPVIRRIQGCLLRLLLRVGVAAFAALSVWCLLKVEMAVIARLLLFAIFMLLTLSIWAVIILTRPLKHALRQLEYDCNEMRDQAVVDGWRTRIQIGTLHARLAKPDKAANLLSIVSSAGPLVLMFLRKEASLFKVAAAAASLGRSVYTTLRKRNN
jgi:hypothetical protein